MSVVNLLGERSSIESPLFFAQLASQFAPFTSELSDLKRESSETACGGDHLQEVATSPWANRLLHILNNVRSTR